MVTNDVNAREDAEALARLGALPPDRIVGLDAGNCPHTTIGDDASQNLAAVDTLIARHHGLDAVFIEGGDDLAVLQEPGHGHLDAQTLKRISSTSPSATS